MDNPIPCLIVSYRNVEALDKCIDSVRTSTVLAEPWVHDNSLRNLGLTKGINKLLQIAQHHFGQLVPHKYVLWLNQDVVLFPDTVENAVKFMDEHPRCAVAGMKQLDTENPDRIIHGGTGDAWPAGHHIRGLVSRGDCNESKKFSWVNMAAAILRMDALDEIGLFDERYFLVGQDSAWCFEAMCHGWEVWYCAECVVFHDSRGVSANPSPEQLKIVNEDMRQWEIWLQESDVLGRLTARLEAELDVVPS